jgi:hypothetical protein
VTVSAALPGLFDALAFQDSWRRYETLVRDIRT